MTAEEKVVRRLRRATNLMAELDALEAEIRTSKRARTARRSSRSPRAPDAKPTKAERKTSDNARQRRVYRAVDARAGGACEFASETTFCLNDAAEHDHFWGRAREESVESVWHLCKFHHDRKTGNEPSRVQWLRWFRYHCFRNDYREQMAKCDRAIALETAQHPARREEETTP